MEAKDFSLTDLLHRETQFFIPIFQRNYAWDSKNCKKLFDDIISIAKDTNRPCHFIGSIIYLRTTPFSSSINEYAVIDGQQRLTTISLLFLALADYSKEFYKTTEEYENSDTCEEKLKNKYLVNQYAKGSLYSKIKLTGIDNKVYLHLIKQSLEENAKSRALPEGVLYSSVHKNYVELLNLMRKGKYSPDFILTGIQKLKIVDIPLSKEDNPQLVFETVNSTGKSLTEAQKIKNFILMTVPPDEQDDLYNEYWLPMEKSLSAYFDSFFSYYVSLKIRKRVGKEYYNTFKEFIQSSKTGTTEAVKEISRFSKHFLRLKNNSGSKPIDVIINNILSTDQLLITPTLMQILDDVETKKCSTSDAIKVLEIIEAYWIRRALCNLPSNTAGTVCFIMLKNLGKANYVKDFCEAILKLTPAQRIPDDIELARKLKDTPLYGKSICRMVLDRIEAHENKDYTHSSNHTIEHIMPQTIKPSSEIPVDKKEKYDWASDLGENWEQIHKTYVDTIGNLTLTGFNSKYQNYRFVVKRDMKDGYKQTPIRISKSLGDLDKWSEEEIISRSAQLAQIIAQIWKYPKKAVQKRLF
ncbi:MAG: DUF262 domain-containing protein [Ruminococcus sp.]|nr:DUF262 domain-containing protein [Ruminococcus sp.]